MITKKIGLTNLLGQKTLAKNKSFVIIATIKYLLLSDNSKPVERRRRKVIGSKVPDRGTMIARPPKIVIYFGVPGGNKHVFSFVLLAIPVTGDQPKKR